MPLLLIQFTLHALCHRRASALNTQCPWTRTRYGSELRIPQGDAPALTENKSIQNKTWQNKTVIYLLVFSDLPSFRHPDKEWTLQLLQKFRENNNDSKDNQQAIINQTLLQGDTEQEIGIISATFSIQWFKVWIIHWRLLGPRTSSPMISTCSSQRSHWA